VGHCVRMVFNVGESASWVWRRREAETLVFLRAGCPPSCRQPTKAAAVLHALIHTVVVCLKSRSGCTVPSAFREGFGNKGRLLS
jgi:hypothetical protein